MSVAEKDSFKLPFLDASSLSAYSAAMALSSCWPVLTLLGDDGATLVDADTYSQTPATASIDPEIFW